MSDILTCTMNPCIDTTTSVEHVTPERKLRCGRPRHEPGGGGINVSKALVRMGIDSTAVFTSGGTMGGWLDAMMQGHSIRSIPCDIHDMTRENFIVREETSGQQYRFGVPGPKLDSSEWEGVLQMIASMDPAPSWLVASGSLPQGVPHTFYARLAETIDRQTTRLIIDTSGDPLRAAIGSGVYLIKPNIKELQDLAGIRIDEQSDVPDLARSIIDKGCCSVVIVSLGAAGAHLVTSDKSTRINAPTVNIQSKVGAGDSMVAGTVAGLYRGLNLEDAAVYGVAAGTAAVMTPGTELCRKEDVERLYAQMKQNR